MRPDVAMFIAVQEEHTMPHRHVKAPGLAFNMVAKTNLSSDKTTYGCVCVSHVYKLGYGNSIVLNYAFFVSYKLYIYRFVIASKRTKKS